MGEAHEAHHSPLLSLTPEALVAAVGNGFEPGRSQTAHITRHVPTPHHGQPLSPLYDDNKDRSAVRPITDRWRLAKMRVGMGHVPISRKRYVFFSFTLVQVTENSPLTGSIFNVARWKTHPATSQ